MNLPVGLRIMHCFSHLSGSHFKGSYEIIVKNLAYEKEVNILQNQSDQKLWKDNPAKYIESLPADMEKWVATTGEENSGFAVNFKANDSIYWDNNDGWNYSAPQACEGFSVVTGREFPIVLGASSLFKSKLRVHVAIQNLAYDKVVGLVYTTDNWQTCHNIYANYYWTMSSGIEVWLFEHNIPASTDVEFALFYQVNGIDYWDNNFYRNYTVSSHSIAGKKAGPESFKDEMWDIQLPKATPSKSKKTPEPTIESKAAALEPILLPAN